MLISTKSYLLYHIFFCSTDSSMIYVAVGYGFYVQFTLDEALKFIEKKSASLTQQSDKLTKDGAKVKAQIKLVIEVGLFIWFPTT